MKTTFQGGILWLDLPDLDRSRETGTVTRAILRQTEFVMDVEAPGDTYAVTLKKLSESRYQGEWMRMSGKGPRRGRVRGELTIKGEQLDLGGEWEEGGTWSWFSRLHCADTSRPQEEGDVRTL